MYNEKKAFELLRTCYDYLHFDYVKNNYNVRDYELLKAEKSLYDVTLELITEEDFALVYRIFSEHVQKNIFKVN